MHRAILPLRAAAGTSSSSSAGRGAVSLGRAAFSSVPQASYLPVADVTNRVLGVVKTIRSVPPTVGPEAKFADLGFDSLIRKELWTKFENEFCVEVPAKDAESNFVSVAAVSKYFCENPKAR